MTQQESLALCFGIAAFSAAALFVSRAVFTKGVRDKFADPLGPANWDFSKSWASTITAVGAVLGTFATALSLPPGSGPMNKADFAVLNVTFGLLAVLGPFVWATFRTASANPQLGAAFTGYVWAFLVAAAITTGAVLGELTTLAMFVHEVQLGAIGIALIVFVGLSALFVAIYCYRTVGEIVSLDAETGRIRAASIAQGNPPPAGVIYF